MGDEKPPRVHGVRVWDLGNVLVAHGATWHFKPECGRWEFADKYRENPIHAERDYAANPPEAVESALADRSMVDRMANRARKSPIKQVEEEAGFTMQELDELQEGYEDWFKGDPTHEYFMHIDMSKENDDTGLCIVHYDAEQDKYVTDLIQTIRKTKEWQLSFERVFHLIVTFQSLGFRFKKVSFDQWQSYNMIERLVNMDIPAELFSVDRGTDAYDTLIELIATGRLDYYYQARFIKEMTELKLYKGNKYDHPPKGSKDTSDAVAGAVAQCAKARIGLALTNAEVQACVHEEHVLDVARERDAQLGMVTYRLERKEIEGFETKRKRWVRIDANDMNLILVLGWHDRHNECLHVDEYLVWENYTNEASLEALTRFIHTAMTMVNIDAFSLGEMVPIEVVTYVRDTGRRVSTPLLVRGSMGNKAANKVATTGTVSDAMIRVCVSQLKKGNLSIPHHPALMKDLKYMTEDNQRHRNYVKALAAWCDFASKEASFGRGSMQAPSVKAASPAPLNAVVQQQSPAATARGSSVSMIDRLRARYNPSSQVVKPQRQVDDGPQQVKRLPRVRSIRR